MKPMCRIFQAGVAVMFVSAFAGLNAASFELAAGFSPAVNPGPPWTFGWFTTIGGPFHLLSFSKTATSDNGVPLHYWQYSNSEEPAVGWNGTTNTAIVYGGLSSFAPGDVVFYSGPVGSSRNFGAIRFTLPPMEGGTYRLEAAVTAVLTNGPASDTDCYIVKNGREVVGWILAPGQGVAYTNEVQLAPGESLDFLIGRGADGQAYGGALKIRARLVPLPWPPVVVPPGLVLPNRAVTNDLARGSGTLVNTAYRVQEVYGSSQFGGVTGAVAITELRFRPDYYYGKAFSTVISNLQISLSTTLRSPGALSPVYSNNIGTDACTVFSGALSVSSTFSGPAEGPKAFDIVVPLQTPFVYDPAQGNLLLDVKNISGSTASLLSGLANSLNEVSRVAGGLASASGTADNYGDVLLVVSGPTNVPPELPHVVGQPESQAVDAGAQVAFAVQATGTFPLSYQWLFNGTPLSGAAASSLTLSNVQVSQAGEYAAVVSNAAGSVTSAVARLTITTPPLVGSYDLARDFSVTNNPNGPWSYGYKTAVDGTFGLNLVRQTGVANNGVPLQLWGFQPNTLPAVYFNATTNTAVTHGGQGTFPPGTVFFLAGNEGTAQNYGAIRFTVPVGGDGQYRLESAVRTYLNGSTSGDTDYHVVRNGVELFGQAMPASSSSGYTNVLTAVAGDTIDFLVGRGADGRLFGSGLIIQARLDRVVPTNEPPVIPSGLVLPNRAVTNDLARGSGTLVNAAFRVQEVYGSSQFGGVTGAIAITELRFRPDYYYGKAFSTVISNLQISLSTTLRSPGALSPVYSNNIGADARTVFSGALSVSSTFSGPAEGPKAFDIVVPLQTPFVYDPAQGNLLLDVKNISGSTASLLSGLANSLNEVSRVAGGLASASGTADNYGDVLLVVYTPTNVVVPPVIPAGLVVPNVMRTNDGAFGSGTLVNRAYRSQQVYAASQFNAITGAIAITELRFRPDYRYGKAFSAVVSNLHISLSTTLAAPETLSATFSNNLGVDAQAVFSGALSVSSQFAGPANGPKAFDIVVPLQTPFIYQPSRGNLLVDIKNFSGSSASLLSGQGVNGDGAARVLGGVNAAVGAADIGCDALEIVYTPATRPSPPPYFGSFQRIVNDHGIVLAFDTAAGCEYRIDASTNLLDWVLIDTIRDNVSGPRSVVDSEARNHPHRFYRVVVNPAP
jgi:hypothetical protein